MKSLLNIEEHPLEPFLPVNAKLLMLGSFPPQKKRWSMEFFYPNLQNDMWRIFGIIFFQNKDHFLNPDKKVFDKERIIDLLNKKGIALYDTASAVRRLQDNASDKFLEVVEQTDISLLLKQIPMCKAIVTTGQKATDIIREQIKVKEPVVGTSEPFEFEDRTMRSVPPQAGGLRNSTNLLGHPGRYPLLWHRRHPLLYHRRRQREW